MFITCISHAEARDKQDVFRGLTEVGWWQVDSAAQRFRALTTAHELSHIGAIVSSPKARCLETAVLLAKALSNFGLLDATEVQVDAGLKAGSIAGDELPELAGRAETSHLLVSGHADLAKALPARFRLDAGAARDGWFSTRPVLFTVAYEPGQPWPEAQVLYCEGLIEKRWHNLVGE